MYNSKGPNSKNFNKKVKADKKFDKKNGIKEDSKRDKVIDMKKFGKTKGV